MQLCFQSATYVPSYMTTLRNQKLDTKKIHKNEITETQLMKRIFEWVLRKK